MPPPPREKVVTYFDGFDVAALLAAAAAKVNRNLLVLQTFDMEGNPDAIRSGAAKKSVEFHLDNSPPVV